jgi:ComEC/Rec2-related protein
VKYFLLFVSYVSLLFGIYFFNIFFVANIIFALLLACGAIIGTFLLSKIDVRITAVPWQKESSKLAGKVLVYLIYLFLGIFAGVIKIISVGENCNAKFETFSGYVTHNFDRGVIITGTATQGTVTCYSKLLVYCTEKSCPQKYVFVTAEIKKRLPEEHVSFSQLLFTGTIVTEDIPGFDNFLQFVMFHMQKLKNETVNKLSLVAPHNIASLYVSILVGGTEISDQDKNDLKDAGLLHLAAISGANISVVISLLEDTIKKLSRRIKELLSVTSVGVFVLFVGVQAPVLRAGFTSLIRIIFLRFGYKISERDAFWIANILLVIFFPEFIWSLSYHLTFVAVFVLIYIVPLVHSKIDKIISKQQKKSTKIKFLKVVLTGVIVQTAVNMVLFMMFHEMGWKGYFMTILTEPFFEAFMIIGYLTFPLLVILPKELIVIIVPILQFLSIVLSIVQVV